MPCARLCRRRTDSRCIIAPEFTNMLRTKETDDMTDPKPSKPQKTDKGKRRRPSLEEIWPVHSAGGWPQGMSLDRADIYDGKFCP